LTIKGKDAGFAQKKAIPVPYLARLKKKRVSGVKEAILHLGLVSGVFSLLRHHVAFP
jgi:hypothetical protein